MRNDDSPGWTSSEREKEERRWYGAMSKEKARVLYRKWFSDATDVDTADKSDICWQFVEAGWTWADNKNAAAEVWREHERQQIAAENRSPPSERKTRTPQPSSRPSPSPKRDKAPADASGSKGDESSPSGLDTNRPGNSSTASTVSHLQRAVQFSYRLR